MSPRVRRDRPFSVGIVTILATAVLWFACDSTTAPETPTETGRLTLADVQALTAHAVELAQSLGQPVVVAISDREGNVLGLFRMTGSDANPFVPRLSPADTSSPADLAVANARTAAYLSSNQHAFTTLTACFITRAHFPPDIDNTPAGPLFGVPYSSEPGSDIQPNGNGLSGAPGGVPLYKDGLLAGGIGIAGATLSGGFQLDQCAGETPEEKIALGASVDFAAPADLRGDGIFIDGIRFLYSNAAAPRVAFNLAFADIATTGTADVLQGGGLPAYPPSGPVCLEHALDGTCQSGALHDFNLRAGTFLTLLDVQRIIGQAVEQANRTRAAIRRPVGVPARVFISVVDLDGSVLGIWRTPDATIFSYDVCVQKARTCVAFSDPNHVLGQRLRTILGLGSGPAPAMSARAVGFLCQDFFPPGIDRDLEGAPLQAGPLFKGPNFAFQALEGLDTFGPGRGNGVTIFPGGVPLYKNGQLVGGLGISGDGVDQDDIIAFFGAKGYEPPPEIRCDRFAYQGVRLPYIKYPRQPNLP